MLCPGIAGHVWVKPGWALEACSVGCSPITHEKSPPAAAWGTWAGDPIHEMMPEELLPGFLIAQKLLFILVLDGG